MHYGGVEECASDLTLTDGDMTPSSGNISQTLDHKDPRPLVNIGWIPGCTAFASQSPGEPIAGNTDISAAKLFEDAYNNCTGNQGLGGYFDVGCLRYGFYPSRIRPNDLGSSESFAKKYFGINSYCG